jgi:hypothetical protein
MKKSTYTDTKGNEVTVYKMNDKAVYQCNGRIFGGYIGDEFHFATNFNTLDEALSFLTQE